MKTCPYCAEQIQDAAIKCKHCGEMLRATPAVARSGGPDVAAPVAPAKVLGGAMAVLGLLLVMWSFGMDVTVEVPEQFLMGQRIGGQRINNIGLMQRQQMVLFLGLGSGLAGVLLALFGPSREAATGAPAARQSSLPSIGILVDSVASTAEEIGAYKTELARLRDSGALRQHAGYSQSFTLLDYGQQSALLQGMGITSADCPQVIICEHGGGALTGVSWHRAVASPSDAYAAILEKLQQRRIAAEQEVRG